MFEFKLPDLGEGIHEGELLQWYVAEGDAIKEDDPLCEVETDKAAVTIPSPRTGTIARLTGGPGDILRVGEVFAVIDDGKGDAAVEKEAAEASGTETEVREPAPSREKEPSQVSPESGAGKPGKRVIAAPATRRLAREMGIDIREVEGSGPGGRVTLRILRPLAASPQGPPEIKEAPKGGAAQVSAPAPALVSDQDPAGASAMAIPFLEVDRDPVKEEGPVEREPIRSLRRKVAVKTASSSILIPHVAHMDEMDVTEIEGVRKAYNEENPDQGKLTLLAFVIKAAAAGLRDYPMFNASVDLGADEIVYKKYYHVGFAADTPRGLMVPVVRDADRQSLAGLGLRIRHLADRARKGEITVGELTGGTFTITNVGAIGGTHVFPIINAPETAILGLGRVEKKPVVISEGGRDEIRIRQILPVTLCFDHRVADGAQAAAFVRDLKAMLESSLAFMARA